MCTRIFGTVVLVKNLHVGMKGINIHSPFTVAVLKSDVIYQEQYWLPVMYSLDEQDLKNSFNFIDLLFPLFLADIK